MWIQPRSPPACAPAACALLIHGHTHRPAVHEFELDGAPARRIVLGAWHEHGSCLSWGPEGFKLEDPASVSRPQTLGGPE